MEQLRDFLVGGHLPCIGDAGEPLTVGGLPLLCFRRPTPCLTAIGWHGQQGVTAQRQHVGPARRRAGAVDDLNRLAPNLDPQKDPLDAGLQRMPHNYRKLARLGAYGSFFNYYLCGVTVRVTDLQGRTAVFPWMKQETGRCSDN